LILLYNYHLQKVEQMRGKFKEGMVRHDFIAECFDKEIYKWHSQHLPEFEDIETKILIDNPFDKK